MVNDLSSFCPQAVSSYFAFLFLWVWIFTFSLFSGGVHTDGIRWIGGHFSVTLPNLLPSWALTGSARWLQTAVWTRFLSGKPNSEDALASGSQRWRPALSPYKVIENPEIMCYLHQSLSSNSCTLQICSNSAVLLAKLPECNLSNGDSNYSLDSIS